MKTLFTCLFLSSILFLVSCTSEPVLQNEVSEHREAVPVMKEELPEDFVPNDYRIVSIGDSLTFGVGDSTKRGGYLPYLEAMLEGEKGVNDAILYNYGVKGNTTEQILTRLGTAEVQEAIEKADLVILTTGGNDMMKVVKENFSGLRITDFVQERLQYEQDLSSIIEKIKKTNPTAFVYLVGLYNPFYQYFADIRELDVVVEDWNRASKSVLEKYPETYYVDIAEEFRNSDENLLHSDYFHPNNNGYSLMAEQIYFDIQGHVLDQLAAQKNKTNKQEKL